MKDTPYKGLGPQDVFFIDKFNMLVAFTPNHIGKRLGKQKKVCRNAPGNLVMGSYLVHYRLRFDLDNDNDMDHQKNTTTGIDIIKSDMFEELKSIYYPHSHPDSISYEDGIVVMSDQYNDHVTVVAVDPSDRVQNMTHLGILTGYHMNHGVALAPNLEYLAVTQYGDNTVIINQFPLWLKKIMLKHRLSYKQSQQQE